MEENMRTWGSRFSDNTDALTLQYTAGADRSLYAFDIAGSMAHARMLGQTGIISLKDSEKILTGLDSVTERIQKGDVEWRQEYEDIHTHIEVLLREEIGEVAGRLHTGRSRNDQVALLNRLLVRHLCDEVIVDLEQLIDVFCSLASEHVNTVMPGYTHLQHAQPITLGHHLLAYGEMFLRDRDRFLDCRVRVNVLPLGSAALAGTTFPIDRNYVAKLLGFDDVTQNSLDSVSDRDFAIEFLACASLIMMHLSRFSEELVLWMSEANRYIDLDDAWCTGSSIMPQKKNPDIPELVRGKTGRVYGDLMALLTLMKAQPLAYNRDNQEDKESLFDAVDTVRMCLTAYAGLVPTITVRHDAMRQAAEEGFATATDLADYLVVQGLPFRDAHAVVGKVVQYAIEKNKSLPLLSLPEFQQFSELIKDDVFAVLKLEGSVSARNHVGATSPEQVKAQVSRLKKLI